MPFYFQSPLEVVQVFEQASEFSVCSCSNKIFQPVRMEQERTARLGTGGILTFQIIFKKLQYSQKLDCWGVFLIKWKQEWKK